MAWSAPITFVAGNVLTAAQMNAIQANLLTTAPALATAGGASGAIFVPTAANAIAQRLITQTEVLTSESTTSNTYVALATAQAVTATTGTQALVMVSAQFAQVTPGNTTNMAYAISGATTVAASSVWAAIWQTTTSNYFGAFSRIYLHTGLTAGSNTFTAQFQTSGGTSANFRNRQIAVIPL